MAMPGFPAQLQRLEDLDAVLAHAQGRGASDVILPSGDRAWMAVEGRKLPLSERRLRDAELMSLLAARDMYGANAQARLASGKPIDTGYARLGEGVDGARRYRVNAVQCLRGGRRATVMTMRAIDSLPPPLDAIGVEPAFADFVGSIRQGLILVCGGTGHGKSTLMASLIRHIVADERAHRNVVTIESPIEYVFDEVPRPSSIVTQLQVGTDIESFQAGVVNALRMAPDVILIGESRDQETIEATVQASQTGHAAISTLHANSVAETVHRMLSAYPDGARRSARQNILQALRLVVAQRLVPRAGGGRVAVRERLSFTETLRHRLMESGDGLAAAIYEALEDGEAVQAQSMSGHARALRAQGLISEATLDDVLANWDGLRRALVSA